MTFPSRHLREWCLTPPGDSNASGGDSGSKHHRGSVSSSTSSGSGSHTANNYSHSNTSDLSDDDLTLNEMLGKFDESYVYEKETDILSDSDPTDCEEDYGETDIDAAQDGGDERDPQDDEELDFIDNGSYVELNSQDMDEGTDKTSSSAKGLVNKGHCTYHMPHSGAEFIRKPTMRVRESFVRRSSTRRHLVKDDSGSGSPGPSSRRSSVRKFHNEEGLSRRSSRDGSRHRRSHEASVGTNSTVCGNPSSRSASEKRRMRSSMRRSCSVRGGTNRPVLPVANNNGVTFNSREKISIVEAENSGVYNLNRILMQKMLFRVNGDGTRSAGNTPVSIRRKISNDEAVEGKKKLLSPARLRPRPEEGSHRLAAGNKRDNNDLQMCSPRMADALMKKRSYSVSCGTRSHGLQGPEAAPAYLATFSSELALIEADREADRKYKELILEAEHILVSMKGGSQKFLSVHASKPPAAAPTPLLRMRKVTTDSAINEGATQVAGSEELVDPEKSAATENGADTKPTFSGKSFSSPKRTTDENRRSAINGSQRMAHSRTCNGEKRPRELGRKRPGYVPEGLVHASSSSSVDTEGSVTPKQSPVQQRPPLVTFRSIDLGHELGGPGYCPQSEPVKRKVYTCSATFDRLQKSLESSQHQASLCIRAEVDRKANDKGKNVFRAPTPYLHSLSSSFPLLLLPFQSLPFASISFCSLSNLLFSSLLTFSLLFPSSVLYSFASLLCSRLFSSLLFSLLSSLLVSSLRSPPHSTPFSSLPSYLLFPSLPFPSVHSRPLFSSLLPQSYILSFPFLASPILQIRAICPSNLVLLDLIILIILGEYSELCIMQLYQ
jgi:hypothetical protein